MRNAIVSDHEQRPKQVLTINDKPFPVADLKGGVRQKVFCYTYFLYIGIIWGYKKVNKLSAEKVVLSKIVPEEILK
jgi:hypothetical protein